jgi:hypothetical protein
MENCLKLELKMVLLRFGRVKSTLRFVHSYVINESKILNLSFFEKIYRSEVFCCFQTQKGVNFVKSATPNLERNVENYFFEVQVCPASLVDLIFERVLGLVAFETSLVMARLFSTVFHSFPLLVQKRYSVPAQTFIGTQRETVHRC